MSWADGTLATFDLETTGFDPRTDGIVQAAVLLVDADGQQQLGSWSSVINPGRPIPPGATEVHGITDERAQREGIPAAQANEEILDRLDQIAAENVPLVVFNAPFDLSFMHVIAQRLGRPMPDLAVIDPLVCDRELDRYRKGPRQLGVMAEHYDCDAGELHDATADATLAAEVARRLARAFPEIASLTPRELHERQVGWYRSRTASYADWLRGQGRDASTVDLGWPIPEHLLS